MLVLVVKNSISLYNAQRTIININQKKKGESYEWQNI